MNALVLEAHRHCPSWAVHSYRGIEDRVRLDKVANEAVHSLAVVDYFLQSRPDHCFALVQIIPTHLVNASLKQDFEMLIDWCVEQSCHE